MIAKSYQMGVDTECMILYAFAQLSKTQDPMIVRFEFKFHLCSIVLMLSLWAWLSTHLVSNQMER